MSFNFEELLKDSINEFGLGWTLCFVGENQSKKLAALTQDLRRGFSTTGDEKRIVSGFSYWGIGPTIAWAYACTDPLYVVMKESIESFRYRWQQIQSNLDAGKYHYVSLGVGTGEKDRDILSFLLNTHPDLLYCPIDMSSQMLRMGVQGATKGLQLKGDRVLPFQVDFSSNKNILELRKLLERVVGDCPILFSLLGNTLANFQQDTELLQTLSKLMREQDKLLIEVAATDDLSEEVAQEAMSEYANSKSFKEFVTSALLQNTDIQIDLNNVIFHSYMEPDKAISIKVVYCNLSGHTTRVMLLDRSIVNFADRDTIRLYLTRKYTEAGIDKVISDSNLTIVDRLRSQLEPHHGNRFGIDLILLAPNGTSVKDKNSSLADAVWRNSGKI